MSNIYGIALITLSLTQEVSLIAQTGCIPLAINTQGLTPTVQIVNAVVYVTVNMLCVMAIMCCHCMIYYQVYKSQKTMSPRHTQKNSNVCKVITKFLMLLLPLMVSWFSACVIVTNAVVTRSSDAAHYIVLLVELLPINSIISPIILWIQPAMAELVSKLLTERVNL